MSESPHPQSAAERPMSAARNIHGRRAGRGLRPFFIVPKILGIACLLGGLAAVQFGVLVAIEPIDVAAWRYDLSVMHRIYTGVILPGLGVALVFGTLLAATIWQVMLRMRWFVVKMVLLLTAVPALHLYMRGRVLALRDVLGMAESDLQLANRLREQITIATWLAILLVVVVIVLGRIKPRLGQRYGRTFGKLSARESSSR